MDDWITIKTLKSRNRSLGTREIAKLLGISRNTVKRALKSKDIPRYVRTKRINPEIEPFKEYIVQQISLKGLICSRVLNDIISKGYKGSKSAFYRYLSKLNLKEKRTFYPYETKEAEQGQFDWSPYTIVINGELTKVFVFNYLLGFSRYRIYQASLSESQSSVFEAIEDSLIELGGTPSRLQTDNAKCFVKNPSRDNFSWNERYIAFCGHYGFQPSRSLPRHPWSKGKVENPFHYLEEHFIKGNQFSSFEDFLFRLKDFQDLVNNRFHTTTRQTPQVLFDKEKDLLLPLAQTRYVGIKEQVRKVTSDCLISFYGNRYSVPSIFALREVWVRVSKGYILEVYSSGNVLIAEHRLSSQKGKVIIEKSHYKNHMVEKGNWERLSQTFIEQYPEQGWFLDKLKTQKRINYSYHLSQILIIADYYPYDALVKAFFSCKDYNVYTCSFIKGYLENNFSSADIMKTKITPISHLSRENIKSISIKRSLEQYKLFN